jgi:hypothetical protein
MTCESAFGTPWRCSLVLFGLFWSASPPASLASSPEHSRADLFVQADDPAAWQPVLSPLGLQATREPSRFRILVGDSPAARQEGIIPSAELTRVASVIDERDSSLEIVWETAIDLPAYSIPGKTTVFMREKWTGAPLLAGWRTSEGGLLWAVTDPGPRGYDRFPYLLQALVELGLKPPLRGSRLWSFFDYSYRTRIDLDYMARRWREAGIAAVHVSAWHFHEPDPERDRYLDDLIAACHRQGVLVYAWFELPHVSESFWRENPRCREKTAVLQDAQLDWRKLVNLADPECFGRAARGVKQMLSRFDWDGVNVAEMYFESLHGPSNPQRFTPMNDWVRRDYAQRTGIDPLRLLQQGSPEFWSTRPETWSRFVDYRAGLALDLQKRLFELVRATVPDLDLVVTQIDDRFDTRMREYLGADAGSLLPWAGQFDFTLAVEDPATLWNLGPDRYPQIAGRYASLVSDPKRLAVDINIVERYQQTYPTKKQVGVELFQLVHMAAEAFSRVLLYFEHSISRPDWELLPFAASGAHARWQETSLEIVSPRPAGVTWRGPATVDGRPWPASDETTVWLPSGKHFIAPGVVLSSPRLLYLNGDLLGARSLPRGLEFEYASSSRAIALVSELPQRVNIDGLPFDSAPLATEGHWALRLPRGRHTARIETGGLIP